MRGKTFAPFVQRTSRGLGVALVLIVVLVPIQAFANEPLPPTEERQHAEQNRCKFLMAKAAQELRHISAVLQGRSWIQRKKLKEITVRIEAIRDELERSWQDSKQPSADKSLGTSATRR